MVGGSESLAPVHSMTDDIVDVCIIGSGVAGLSTALSLQQIGLKVVVYERDLDFIDRKQGYGLTLTYSTNGPLSKLGVLEECIANNCPSHCHYVFDPKGSVLGYYGRELRVENDQAEEQRQEQGGNRGNLRIPRQDLRMMLIRRLQPDTIVWGCSFLDYTESKECVTIRLASRIQSATPITNGDSTTTVRARVLVGSDGIRSVVRQQRDLKHFISRTSHPEVSAPQPTLSPISYLGVAVIIGLSSTSHPLINNRGFYVVDGQNRMFTMPYVAPKVVDPDCAESAQPGLTMWQLSFSGLTEDQATALRRSSPGDILAEALRRTEGWFEPAQAMIQGTLDGELWATGLYDRDTMPLFSKDSRSSASAGTGGSRVTVIGDAAHPMSMFKGQGANQALADGPLLAQWLGGTAGSGGGKRRRGKDSKEVPAQEEVGDSSAQQADREALANQQTVFTRLRCFERDMTARASPKAQASREAARHLHSPEVLHDVFGIAGVQATDSAHNTVVLDALRKAGVDASLREGLDGAMRIALKDFMTATAK